jgi:hypothetical protein
LKLLPQAWTFGFLYTYATTQIRSTYLLGRTDSISGWCYYFPLAMLFKTPLATLIAAFGTLTLSVMAYVKRKQSEVADPSDHLDLWTLLCLLIPPGIYMLAAMTSNLNLGLRHILPVYPYIFIGIAVCAARWMQMNAKRTQIIAGALALLLAVESVIAYPNYLPFFNLPFRAWRFKLLGDSNLDWGQDLLLLRDWYEKHRDKPLYLSYFGTAEPAHYGISYVNLGAGNALHRQYRLSDIGTPGYAAISATNLQGIYHEMKDTPEYKELRETKPLAVLGGTIYIYEWNPKR